MLSRDDIKQAMVDGHIKIYPFSSKNLTGIGYNLSTTHFAFSINQGILLTINNETKDNKTINYVNIPPNDTIIFFTNEYIAVDNTIAGTFHSKVARVSEGLGHFSTTLDPTWKGQLLLSVNNPTNKPIKFNLDGSGNIITLLFHKLDTPVTGDDIHDNNNRGRCDLLKAHFCKDYRNKALQKKHLELKAFIENELEPSLNGEGNYLTDDSVGNSINESVEILKQMLNRLQDDKKKIQEDRYPLGSDGDYSVFNTDNEKEVFKKCVLYSISKSINSSGFDKFEKSLGFIKSGKPLFGKKDLKNVLPVIDKCINIISYQKEQINHFYRINWHNSRVDSFAKADSELVIAQRKVLRKQNWIKFGIPLGVLILLVAALIAFSCLKTLSSFGEKTIIAFISTFVTAAVTLGLKWWHNRKTAKDESKK